MLLLAVFTLTLISVPLAGGRLSALAELRLPAVWALGVALVVQLAVTTNVLADAPGASELHVVSYLFVGWFVWRNRTLPGIRLVALGGLLNFAAIAANGGVMPALPSALRAAGIESAGGFQNSAAIAGARLSFLGDVFAVPAPIPLHNVFSIGDVCIVLGAALVLHRICASRLTRAGGAQIRELRRQRAFVRLWASQAVSNLGDWVYTLAVATSLSLHGGSARDFATILVLQVGPSAVIGMLGGPLVDRLSRKKLMIAADVLRAGAVATLFLAPDPSRAHLYAVAFCLGVFGALFLPSLQASLPNVVREDQVVAANAVVATTHHLAIMIGPVLGGFLVGRIGATAAFAVNSLSFLVSAAFLAGVRLPRPTPEVREQTARESLVEGIRYIVSTPLVRAVFGVLGLIMVAAAIKSPLEPLFVLETLRREPGALGLVGGAWGVGMVLGSLLAPALARAVSRERLFAASIAVVGAAVVLSSQQATLPPLLFLWFLAGAGNGMGTVSYESILQQRVPDAVRGRVMGAAEAVLDGSYLLGALASGALGVLFGVRLAFAASGAMFLVAAAVAHLTIRAARDEQPATEAAAQAASAETTAAANVVSDGGALDPELGFEPTSALDVELASLVAGDAPAGEATRDGGGFALVPVAATSAIALMSREDRPGTEAEDAPLDVTTTAVESRINDVIAELFRAPGAPPA